MAMGGSSIIVLEAIRGTAYLRWDFGKKKTKINR